MSVLTRTRRLKSVKPGKGFTLVLIWEDGAKQNTDLSGLVAAPGHFRRFLSDPQAFRKIEVINWGHGVGWPNGLDYSAANLARIADEQQERDDREEFLAWQEAHDLTNEEAGAILGYKKSQIKNFRSGEAKIPASVSIAMRAFDADPTMFFAHYRPSDQSLARRQKAAVAHERLGN